MMAIPCFSVYFRGHPSSGRFFPSVIPGERSLPSVIPGERFFFSVIPGERFFFSVIPGKPKARPGIQKPRTTIPPWPMLLLDPG